MKLDQAKNTSTKKYMNTSIKTSIPLYVGWTGCSYCFFMIAKPLADE